MPTEVIHIADIIADKIKIRYAEITERTMGSANMVVDAFYPTYVRESLVAGNRPHELSKKCSAISPFIAKELGVYNISIEDITKMLGYKKQDLKTIVEAVKSKKIQLVLVGLGGTGMNFMHWAEEVSNYVNSVNVFESIEIWDADNVDLTNIFRFPQILNPENSYSNSKYGPMAKISMLNRNNILSRTRLDTHHRFIDQSTLMRKVTKEFDAEGRIIDLPEPRMEFKPEYVHKVYYGAPDIATREMFSAIPEMKFISGTHGDDDCQLYIKPEQDSTIQIESYGMINLSVFFMNQVKLTISFFELLASDADLAVSQLIMDYSFSKEYIDGQINKAGLNRTYNFPIMRNNLIDQELNIPEVAVANEEENPVDTALSNVVNEAPALIEEPGQVMPAMPVSQAASEAMRAYQARRAQFKAETNSGFQNFSTRVSSNFVPRTPTPTYLDLNRAVAEEARADTVIAATPAPARTRARRRTPAEMALARAEAAQAAVTQAVPTTNLV